MEIVLNLFNDKCINQVLRQYLQQFIQCDECGRVLNTRYGASIRNTVDNMRVCDLYLYFSLKCKLDFLYDHPYNYPIEQYNVWLAIHTSKKCKPDCKIEYLSDKYLSL